MKILFLCGSLQPGHDGVGDYTRRLCGALLKKGHQVQILSLFDNHATSFSDESQEIDGTPILVNRIVFSTSNNQRYIWSQDVLNNFKPEWISLQFVPYSFNPRGLPFWLPSFLKKLRGNHQWHIMFHELWIGMDWNTTFKSKCIGLLQKRLILKILKRKEKIIINTQTDLYQSKIATLGYNAQLLPLLSNIIKNSDSLKISTDAMELKFCIFGSIHHGAPVEKFIHELKQVLLLSNEKRALKFIFIGNCGVALEDWKQVLSANSINFEITGFVSDEEISVLLSSCQYGISTTPYILCQKSGTVAAMFNHEIPVLCVARNWKVNGYNQVPFLNLINYENLDSIQNFLNTKFIISNNNNLEFVANKFLNVLK
jgi:glycosyltransferase involved in cell wall biosynthesis